MALAGSLGAGTEAPTQLDRLTRVRERPLYLVRSDGSIQPPKLRGRFAVIPTKGNRNDILDKLVTRLQSENIQVIIIDTSPNNDMFRYRLKNQVSVLWDRGDINISRWWATGWDSANAMARYLHFDEWNIAFLNDDCLPRFGWFDEVSHAMRRDGSVAGCSGTASHQLTKAEPVNLWYRMTGWAFIVAGETKEVWPAADLKWWYTDDHIDWSARIAGGMTMVAGGHVDHYHPNGQMTPELQVIAAQDRENFIKLWDRTPF